MPRVARIVPGGMIGGEARFSELVAADQYDKEIYGVDRLWRRSRARQ